MSRTCSGAALRSLLSALRHAPAPRAFTLPPLSSPLRHLSTAPASCPAAPVERPVPSEELTDRAERVKPKGKSKTPPKQRAKKELPELREEDLEESFVRGSGPGGQATNKTSNACSLIHRPTGTRVLCHETRSRETNRKLARRWMREKLDQLLSPPGQSAKDLAAARERQKKEAKRRKAKRKVASKRSEDGGEGEEGEGGEEAEGEEGWVEEVDGKRVG